MDEVGGFLAGERDYNKLAGGTGPLVYPAGFVYIYSALKLATRGAVRPAQWVFAAIYLASQASALAVTVTARVVPPAALPLLAASKRLHSIYLLRCFNDGISVLLTLVGTLVLARGAWIGAVVLFSAAVSVKMSALLAAPPVAALILQGATPTQFIAAVTTGVALQLGLGAPFLATFPREYVSRAFEFSRVFFFKWSVNWQFLPEPVFLGKPLALTLLACHLGALAWFWSVRWSAGDGGPAGSIRAFFTSAGRKTRRPSLHPAHVVTTVAVGNFIGIVFARSLHYQVRVGWRVWVEATEKKPRAHHSSPPFSTHTVLLVVRAHAAPAPVVHPAASCRQAGVVQCDRSGMVLLPAQCSRVGGPAGGAWSTAGGAGGGARGGACAREGEGAGVERETEGEVRRREEVKESKDTLFGGNAKRTRRALSHNWAGAGPLSSTPNTHMSSTESAPNPLTPGAARRRSPRSVSVGGRGGGDGTAGLMGAALGASARPRPCTRTRTSTAITRCVVGAWLRRQGERRPRHPPTRFPSRHNASIPPPHRPPPATPAPCPPPHRLHLQSPALMRRPRLRAAPFSRPRCARAAPSPPPPRHPRRRGTALAW